MLEDLRRLFRTSIDAFRSELNARDPEDQIAEVLSAMRREMVAAKAMISELEDDLVRTKEQLGSERMELERCVRRAEMATRIEDRETVRVATEFADRHREKVRVLEQKSTAVEAEIALRRREANEMRLRYREADANRFALLSQLRRAAATDRMRSSTAHTQGPFADLERMEERVRSETDILEALDELDRRPSERSGGSSAELDERLRELKRRMGRE